MEGTLRESFIAEVKKFSPEASYSLEVLPFFNNLATLFAENLRYFIKNLEINELTINRIFSQIDEIEKVDLKYSKSEKDDLGKRLKAFQSQLQKNLVDNTNFGTNWNDFGTNWNRGMVSNVEALLLHLQTHVASLKEEVKKYTASRFKDFL